MIRFLRCFIWVLGAAVMVPAVCPAQDSDRSFFPLPLSVEVGDGWTYSIVTTLSLRDGTWGLDTLSTETLTIRVVERLQIADQTYFALSDGGIYRVDEARRTWRYDTDAGSEKIVWDIWRPLKASVKDNFDWSEPIETVVDGYACAQCFSRYGPYVRQVVQIPEFGEADIWVPIIYVPLPADLENVSFDFGGAIETLLDGLYVWSYADIIKFPDWGVTELYLLKDRFPPISTFVVEPNVGVVYSSLLSYQDLSSPGAGKVGYTIPLEAV